MNSTPLLSEFVARYAHEKGDDAHWDEFVKREQDRYVKEQRVAAKLKERIRDLDQHLLKWIKFLPPQEQLDVMQSLYALHDAAVAQLLEGNQSSLLEAGKRALNLARFYRAAPALLARDAKAADAILRDWQKESKTRITRDQANTEAMKVLRRVGTQKITARELAKEVGCSLGLIPKLRIWKERQRVTGKTTRGPKTIRLTDKLLQTTTGHDDNQLKKLAADAKQRDERPSPARQQVHR